MKKRRITIHPMAAISLLTMLLLDRSGVAAMSLLAALIHEFGHLLAARLLRIPLSQMRLELLGARLEVEGRMLTYGEEWLLCAAGPLASLISSLLSSFLWAHAPYAILYTGVSFLLGVLNLLPVQTFDGGRMLECTLLKFLGVRSTSKILKGCSFFLLWLMWVLAIYFLIKAGDGLSLFCFSLGLMSRFFRVSD